MIKKRLKPNPRYIYKLRSILVILAIFVLAVGVIVAALLSQDHTRAHLASPVLKAVLVLDLVWLLPAFEFTKAYYRSLLYEFHEGEISISSGVWTQSVNHIPYWSVSGVMVKRDVLDRWLEIATLSIQTSSMDVEIGKDQKLVGLSDVSEVVEDLESALLCYRKTRKTILQERSEIMR